MRLSGSDGTIITIEKLEQARVLLGSAFENIVEINTGTYRRDQEPIQFDYVSCPQLVNLIDSIEEIAKKISKKVYQE